MDPKIERDIWTDAFERQKREYIAKGLSPEEAEDRASAEIRRQIRGQVSGQKSDADLDQL